ncbi:hypothetical protein ACFV9W_37760 [Streptomyces sp. NPDC059897]|uniref:hypothetical protein n=1 Tax=Streptomyces sp. NPDC059897 TaxID=3346994 RepID=UPI0036621171
MTASQEKREVDPADLEDVESPERAQDVLRAMRALASNPKVDDTVREMARGVLSGNLSLREAVLSDVYMDAVGARVSEAFQAAKGLAPEEEQKNADRFNAWVAEQRRADEAESPRTADLGRTPSGAVHDLRRS